MSGIALRLAPGRLDPTTSQPSGHAVPRSRNELTIDPNRITTEDLRRLAGLLHQDFNNLSSQETLSPAEEVYVQKAALYGSRALVRTAVFRSAQKPHTRDALTRLQAIHASAELYHNVMQHSGNSDNRQRFSTTNFGGEDNGFPSYADFATDTRTLGAVLAPFTSHSAPLYDETLEPVVSRMPRHQLERLAGNVLGSLADVVEANGGGTNLDEYLQTTLLQIADSRNAAIDALQVPTE